MIKLENSHLATIMVITNSEKKTIHAKTRARNLFEKQCVHTASKYTPIKYLLNTKRKRVTWKGRSLGHSTLIKWSRQASPTNQSHATQLDRKKRTQHLLQNTPARKIQPESRQEATRHMQTEERATQQLAGGLCQGHEELFLSEGHKRWHTGTGVIWESDWGLWVNAIWGFL